VHASNEKLITLLKSLPKRDLKSLTAAPFSVLTTYNSYPYRSSLSVTSWVTHTFSKIRVCKALKVTPPGDRGIRSLKHLLFQERPLHETTVPDPSSQRRNPFFKIVFRNVTELPLYTRDVEARIDIIGRLCNRVKPS
jgi:hypothetical protein